jgi:acyl carrier protein
MSIKQEIKTFILNNYLFTDDASALADGVSLMRSGVIDSTGILELIAHVEERYALQVQPEEMVPDNFDSIDRVAAFVERKRTTS